MTRGKRNQVNPNTQSWENIKNVLKTPKMVIKCNMNQRASVPAYRLLSSPRNKQIVYVLSTEHPVEVIKGDCLLCSAMMNNPLLSIFSPTITSPAWNLSWQVIIPHWGDNRWYSNTIIHTHSIFSFTSWYIAKLSSSQVQVQSNWELRLVLISLWHHPPTPPHPDKYIWATSRPPRRLKFGMKTLFNKTRSTS